MSRPEMQVYANLDKKEYLCSPVRGEARILPGCIAGPVSVRTEIGYAESKK